MGKPLGKEKRLGYQRLESESESSNSNIEEEEVINFELQNNNKPPRRLTCSFRYSNDNICSDYDDNMKICKNCRDYFCKIHHPKERHGCQEEVFVQEKNNQRSFNCSFKFSNNGTKCPVVDDNVRICKNCQDYFCKIHHPKVKHGCECVGCDEDSDLNLCNGCKRSFCQNHLKQHNLRCD